jgi:hypothetical protein
MGGVSVKLFALFLLVIVLFVFLRISSFDYPFDIFKLFCSKFVVYAKQKSNKAKPRKTSYIYVSAYGVCDPVFEFSNKYSPPPPETRDYMFYAGMCTDSIASTLIKIGISIRNS